MTDSGSMVLKKYLIKIILCSILLLFLSLGSTTVLAQTKYKPTVVRVIDTSILSSPIPDPMGIGYRPETNTLFVVDSEIEEYTHPYLRCSTNGTVCFNVFEMSLSGLLVGTYSTLSFSDEPTEVSINPTTNHFFFSDDNAYRVYEVDIGADSIYGTADDAASFISVGAFGSNDTEGMAINTWNGHILVEDGGDGTKSVYDVAPGVNGRFDGVSPKGDDVAVKLFGITGPGDPEGIDFNRDAGTIFVVGSGGCWCVEEITMTGEVIRQIDISALPGIRSPSGVAYAPSSVTAGAMSLYITDRGIDNDSNALENDGKIYEITLSDVTATPTIKQGDVNNDGRVTLADLSILLSNFGKSSQLRSEGDLNNDELVNLADLSLLLSKFGT